MAGNRRRTFSQRTSNAKLFAGGQRVAVIPDQIVDRSIDDVKRRRHRLAIYTHTPKLSEPTDKKRHAETTEAKVTQVISAIGP